MRKVTMNQWWYLVIREYNKNNLDARLDRLLEKIVIKWRRIQAWFTGKARIRNWKNFTTTGRPDHAYIRYFGGNWYNRWRNRINKEKTITGWTNERLGKVCDILLNAIDSDDCEYICSQEEKNHCIEDAEKYTLTTKCSENCRKVSVCVKVSVTELKE